MSFVWGTNCCLRAVFCGTFLFSASAQSSTDFLRFSAISPSAANWLEIWGLKVKTRDNFSFICSDLFLFSSEISFPFVLNCSFWFGRVSQRPIPLLPDLIRSKYKSRACVHQKLQTSKNISPIELNRRNIFFGNLRLRFGRSKIEFRSRILDEIFLYKTLIRLVISEKGETLMLRSMRTASIRSIVLVLVAVAVSVGFIASHFGLLIALFNYNISVTWFFLVF